MKASIKKGMWFYLFLILPVALYAQKDVTQFLGIPVDGSKSEMIEKLKDKGYTISPYKKDGLVGEFNGTDVQIYIATNNNKVRRIAVMDANPMSESNIKIRFNNLLHQFRNNTRYLPTPDSTIVKYTIPQDEDISFQLLVNKKSYQATFFQQTAVYDSLTLKINTLKKKQTSNDGYTDQLTKLLYTNQLNQINELYNCFNKKVWVSIYKLIGGYGIAIYYDNVYNESNGEGL